jgi:hypothetical protein
MNNLDELVHLHSRERMIIAHLRGTPDSARQYLPANTYLAFLQTVEEILSEFRRASAGLAWAERRTREEALQ